MRLYGGGMRLGWAGNETVQRWLGMRLYGGGMRLGWAGNETGVL